MSIRTKRSTRSFAAVVAAALIASVLALVAGPVSATTPIQGTTSTSADGRVSGSDRYGTATAAASSYLVRRGALSSWNRIVVVSGDNFPDALSAASLAGSYAAPIILMPSDGSLPTVVKEWGLTKRDQIQTNSTTSAPFKLVIVGGTSAVPDAGVDALLAVLNAGDLTPASKTRISGSSRSATAKAVMTQTNAAGSYTILSAAKELFVANENSFADAMSIAPYLFNASAPLVLTGKDALGADALSVIKTYKTLGGTKITLLGGTAALSEQIVKDIVNNSTVPLSSVSRIFGADRYATGVAIQNYVDATSVNNDNFGPASVVLVSGSSFADGLAAAPYAGFSNGTGTARLMYLTEGTSLSSAVAAKFSALAKVETNLNSLYVVGGTSAVSATTVAGATTSAQALNTTSTMTCVENAASTSVKITIPGNASDTNSTGSGWLGDETANIKNGSLTINGASNTNAAATVMASAYSTVTKTTTLTGLVPAASLTKGNVITWSGLSELANKAVGKRTIAGSSCTVADDKLGPAPTVTAAVGASEFIVTFNEKVLASSFDCSDMEITIAAQTTAPIGCTITGPDASGKVFKVNMYVDYNGNNAQDAAISSSIGTVQNVGPGLLTIGATHNLLVGDQVVIATATPTGTYFVEATGFDATHIAVSTEHSLTGLGTRVNGTVAGATGGITKLAEPAAVLAAGDTIVMKPQLTALPLHTALATVAAATGLTGGKVTFASVHGLSVHEHFKLETDLAADDGVYAVTLVDSTTVVSVRAVTALTTDGTIAATVVSENNRVIDQSDNNGSASVTKTLNAVTDADVTKPILSVKVTCVQGTEVVIGNGGTLKATAHGTYGPQGVNGNVYKMHITNSRGSLMPSVTVDDTAKTIKIVGDLAYITASDVQSVYAQSGGVAWTFAIVTGAVTDKLGTASATTAAAPLSYATGTAGVQSCTVKVSSTEVLQTMIVDATTAVAAVNGVATPFTTDGTSTAMTVASGWKSFTISNPIALWKLPIADNTVTITLNGTLIKDQKGNTVTLLSLVD